MQPVCLQQRLLPVCVSTVSSVVWSRIGAIKMAPRNSIGKELGNASVLITSTRSQLHMNGNISGIFIIIKHGSGFQLEY